MGKMADRSAYKKHWIVLGGLLGSAGLLGMYFASGVYAAALAVVLLAVASCLAGGAQTSYMLSLVDVRRYGAGGATIVMRAADKRSEEQTSDLQSRMRISYPVFCLKKKK